MASLNFKKGGDFESRNLELEKKLACWLVC